jgi:hypothetical protein
MRSPSYLCVCESPPINYWMPELDMYIMTPEPISMAYFINPSHQSVNPHIVARQQFSKNVTVATNTHMTIEELLDTSFSMQFMSYTY